MTIKIWYKSHKMFNIDIYVKPCNTIINGECLYCTEVKSSLIADGIGYYILDNIHDQVELESLLCDVNHILDFTEILFKGYDGMPSEWENYPINCFDADMRMCRVHLPKFLCDLQELCHKYNFSTNID